MAITSKQIDQQLAALDTHIAEHEAKAKKLAFAAVSGDKDAAAELALANAEVKRASADRVVLEQAHEAASAHEASAAYAAEAEERAQYLDEARSNASEIVKLAKKADALIAEFRAVTLKIDEVERQAQQTTRRSGAINPNLVGSNGLVEYALSRLDIAVRGTRIYDKRSVEQIASSGWRFLLETDESEAA